MRLLDHVADQRFQRLAVGLDPSNLLWVLESLVDGKVVNPIRVDDEVAEGALLALERMLALKGDGAVAQRPAPTV